MGMMLVCREDNDLVAVLRHNAVGFSRYDTAGEALEAAPAGSGLLILADNYPASLTGIDPSLYARAAEKRVRLYVEFPARVPGAEAGAIHTASWERAVVASDAFAPSLEPMRILMLHRCRFVQYAAAASHIVMARVAGFDTALYGLPQTAFPVLFEHPHCDLLVATSKLSQFVTGRYAPSEAWTAVWQWILAWACPGTAFPALMTTPSVRPAYAPDASLPDDIETQALRRGIGWFSRARLFIHPAWQDEAQWRLDTFPDGTGPGPQPDWPTGDGRCGMLEGASSTIHPDGTQDWRYHLRNDCIGEASMAHALAGVLLGDSQSLHIAANLNDYIYFESVFAQGPRADPESPSYGLLSWSSQPPADGVYYGDDNARSMLGTMAASAALGTDRWDRLLLRCLLANLRTTGPLGFRSGRLEEGPLQEHGWRHYWETERVHYAPHYEGWLWACCLWAYHHTGFEPFLTRPTAAIRRMMAVYPDEWRWTNGIQQERARMLLPLAWLVRVHDTPEHRGWLRLMAGELLQHQDPCGAIREEVGSRGHGQYGPSESNEAYGTTEAPLIQQNGDPLCDLLYTTNFAFAGLHEAAAATGDPFYAGASNRLAHFLCRIQARSERHTELDGGWFRAFDFRRWDYWASNADAGWGAWSIESGWTQSWITAVLALREMRTSLWELTAGSRIGQHLDALVRLMLPDMARGLP